LIIVAFYQET